MDQDNAMTQVPLRDLRRAIAAMSMLRDSMEHLEHLEDQEAHEISEFVERLKGYHNAAVEQHGGEQEQLI